MKNCLYCGADLKLEYNSIGYYQYRKFCKGTQCANKYHSEKKAKERREKYGTLRRKAKKLVPDADWKSPKFKPHPVACFNVIAQAICSIFLFNVPSGNSQHQLSWLKKKREEDMFFLNSKVVSAFCDCTENFEINKLKKKYELVATSTENTIRQKK